MNNIWPIFGKSNSEKSSFWQKGVCNFLDTENEDIIF